MHIRDLIGRLSDAEIARAVGFDTLMAGRRYALAGAVAEIDESSNLVVAQVRGRRMYTSILSMRRDQLVLDCSCPLTGDCKHCIAVIMQLRAHELTPRPVAAANWRTVLDALTDADQLMVPLALQFAWSASTLTVQPRCRGRSGRWVKSDVDWQRLRSRRDLQPQQRDALLGLGESLGAPRTSYSYYHVDPGQPLSLRTLSRSGWQWLRQAQESGVELLAPPGASGVELGAPASVVAEATTADDGGIRLRLFADVDGTPVPVGMASPGPGFQPPPRHHDRDRPTPQAPHGPAVQLADADALELRGLVGEPTNGLVLEQGTRVHLVPLDRDIDDALGALARRDAPLEVPAADAVEFVSRHLPALRRRASVRDEALTLPTVGAPVLVLDLAVHERGGDLTWAFRYDVGGRAVEFAANAPSGSPVRDPDAEQALAASLDDGPWRVVGSASRLSGVTLVGREWMRFVEHILPGWQQRDDVVVVRLSGEPRDYREAEAPQVRVGVQPPDAAHWFGLDVDVTIDGEPVPFSELFTALTLGQSELVLESGLWFDLERPELQALRQLIQEASALSERPADQLGLRIEHASLWQELVDLGVVAEQSLAWQESVDALLHVEHLPEVDPGDSVTATLRPYQLAGFRWLAFLWRARLGGILADEMGLGKTLQALSLLAWARDEGELDHPALVVAPTSVLDTWVREAHRFAPGLRVVARTRTTRASGVDLATQAADADLVVTSYALLRLDEAEFVAQNWSAVLLDEAQFVKNRQSRAHRVVRRLPARIKIALTGTPLENNLMDLWSMLSIVAPGLFSDPTTFTELYRRPIESGDGEALARLQRRIRPLVLRRTKNAVATELPPKQEAVLEVELDPAHRRLYDRQLQRERQKVLKLVDDLDHHRVSVLRSLTTLRQLALSPHLVDADAPPTSAKIDVLVERIKELAADGHRALVFSQFTRFLDLTRARLSEAGVSASWLDGRTRDRERRIQAFREGDDPVFLISLKAGGFGLTLVEADYVFILDPWWNPAAENQAIDRTHRIGQTAHVMVYRLVSANTIEQKVLDLQRAKQQLFDQVVAGADADLAAPLDADDIRALLEP